MHTYLLLIIVGFFSGIFGGLLGIGGSVILLPALSIIFADRFPAAYQHVYQASAMIMNFFVALSAVNTHYKNQTIQEKLVRKLIPITVMSSFLGITVSNLPIFTGDGANYLKKFLGVFLLYVMLYNLYKLFYKTPYQREEKEKEKEEGEPFHTEDYPTSKALFIGFPTGFLAGLMGIGGGSICVPLQQIFLKTPLPSSIANSTAVILFTSIFAAIYKNATIPPDLGGITGSLTFAAFVVPPASVGSYIGSHLTYLVPKRILTAIFSAAMLYGGIRLLSS